MDKKQLRKEYLIKRKEIRDKSIKSHIIFERIIAHPFYQNAQIIALYNHMNQEVDTAELIHSCFNDGKKVCLPKVEGDDIFFYQIEENETYQLSDFKVLEPIGNLEKLIPANKIDLVIVPGVCFDKFKNRIGYGKGFYDRFLSQQKFKTIAICFDEQVYDGAIDCEKGDQRMDLIITDSQMIT